MGRLGRVQEQSRGPCSTERSRKFPGYMSRFAYPGDYHFAPAPAPLCQQQVHRPVKPLIEASRCQSDGICLSLHDGPGGGGRRRRTAHSNCGHRTISASRARRAKSSALSTAVGWWLTSTVAIR